MKLDPIEKYHKSARQEKYEVIKALMAWKLKEADSACNHVQIIQRYIGRLEKLNVNFDEELAIDMVLNSLPPFYD